MSTILIVDDDAHNLLILSKLLTHERYSVITAHHGLGALEAVEMHRPDLVLLDVMMPILDGFEVTRRLRADGRFLHLPIIVISAKGQTSDITEGLDAGANDYLSKPIILEELLARVRTQLRLKEAQDRLTRANEELQRLNELKSRVVSTVSHELRTPLTSIRGALDLVRKMAADQLPAKYLQLLDISIRNTDRLVRLINEVLDFARLEKGRMDFRHRPFSIEPWIADAVEEVTALSDPFQIRITTELDSPMPPAYGDPERLHQVLVNLLSNAIKFSPAGSGIRVRGTLDTPGWLTVQVTDWGRGLDEDEQKQLFQPFHQIDHPVHRLGGGTGLGLVISRDIVERHGGNIQVESARGTGSTFSFTVPLAPGHGAFVPISGDATGKSGLPP